MSTRRKFIGRSLQAGAALALAPQLGFDNGSPLAATGEIRLGIIGLDTSHSPAFARLINQAGRGVRVTAAHPYGSTRIASSAQRIPQYTAEIRELGVVVVENLDELLSGVDGVLLETNDGALHLEQARKVFRAGKPVFIDKPVAAGLPDVIRIYREAAETGIPVFSASGLRYLDGAQRVRHQQAIGDVMSADAYSPVHIEPTHSELFWYGIHGVEILYTVMNRGCREVQRVVGPQTDLVIGRWDDGRIGIFRGDREGRQHYGGTANGTKGVMAMGPFDGYGGLVDHILEFFLKGVPPVDPEETIELYTFMAAAERSSQQQGTWIRLDTVYQEAGGR
jgi:hypothetical protein